MKQQDQRFKDEVVRNDKYVTEIPTQITLEEAHADNPFHTENMYIFGYEHTDLMENKDFLDMTFLMLQGELPTSEQKRGCEKLMCCLINPGPRHPASRAAMNAGVARTKMQHVLPLSLLVASGSYMGSEDVFNAMRFLYKSIDDPAESVANKAIETAQFDCQENPQIAAGFGSYYGGIDTYAAKLANYLEQYNPQGQYFSYAKSLINNWQHLNAGWLLSGLTASVLCDLGFEPKQGHLIFQLAIAPGLAAHGAEKSKKPVTDMPFVSEQNYFIDESALSHYVKKGNGHV